MVIVAIVSLIFGIICGSWIFPADLSEILSLNSDLVLYFLMFAVGISIGMNKGVFEKIKEYHIKIFIIPFGIIIGSVLGGFLSAFILRMSFRDSVMVTSGLGWYSLSGIMITDLAGAELGTISFLANLMRELLAFLMIPFLSRNLNYYTAIAPAAATSEDTTLPILMRFTNEEVAVMAVFNGVICSAFVPVLIRFFYMVLN